MKRLQLLAVFAAFFSSILLAGGSDAAIRPSAFSLTPFAGGYLFEGNQGIKKDGPTYGLALGYNLGERWGVEGVASFVDGEVAAGTEESVDVYGLRLDLLYHFRPDKDFVPYLAAGLGGLSLDTQGDSDEDGLFNYGLGCKYFVTESVALRADVRHILDINLSDRNRERDFFNNLAYTAGLTFQFGGSKAVPSPSLPRDSDGDGVADQFDRCPDTGPGVPVDGFGCPLDSDGDGVYDFVDRCPETPAGTAVDEKGCPRAAAPDTDGDGIADAQDKCSNTPAGVPVNRSGCPKDSDGDGVFDFEDRCPETPRGTAVDAAGCPPAAAAPAPAAAALPSLTLQLEFTSGQAGIRPEFEKDLRAAADFIQAHPGARILVEGHTDSIGSVESNLGLSKARAAEVRRYLVETHNLDGARIETQGFGEARPVADNATPDGRVRNRRVVITVVPER